MELLAYPVVQGAIAGFLAAFVVDLQAWKSWEDARFNLGVASFRWVQGALIGGLSLLGVGAVS